MEQKLFSLRHPKMGNLLFKAKSKEHAISMLSEGMSPKKHQRLVNSPRFTIKEITTVKEVMELMEEDEATIINDASF